MEISSEGVHQCAGLPSPLWVFSLLFFLKRCIHFTPLPPATTTHFKSQALPPKNVKFQLKTHQLPDGDDWGIPDALGPCPPTIYFPGEPDIRNPYSMRDADWLKLMQPIMNGIDRYLIKPLLQEESIIYPDDTETNPNLDDDFNSLAGPDQSTTEPSAPVDQQFWFVESPIGIPCDRVEEWGGGGSRWKCLRREWGGIQLQSKGFDLKHRPKPHGDQEY